MGKDGPFDDDNIDRQWQSAAEELAGLDMPCVAVVEGDDHMAGHTSREEEDTYEADPGGEEEVG